MTGISLEELSHYQRVQNIALRVLRDVTTFIRFGVSEKEIFLQVENLLKEQGVAHTESIQVQVGRRSMFALSAQKEASSTATVDWCDIVTIDLSPRLSSGWGDCARSYIVVEGRVVSEHAAAQVPGAEELCDGVEAVKKLHALLALYTRPSLSIGELHQQMSEHILRLGFENKAEEDSLGHGIEKRWEDHRLIVAGSGELLGNYRFFSFAPHIAMPGGAWGFKRKNIYYFDEGRLTVLGSEALLEVL